MVVVAPVAEEEAFEVAVAALVAPPDLAVSVAGLVESEEAQVVVLGAGPAVVMVDLEVAVSLLIR